MKKNILADYAFFLGRKRAQWNGGGSAYRRPGVMKKILINIILIFAGGVGYAEIDIHYVRPSATCTNTTLQSPYTNWDMAATQIQWAVDASDNGDTVLVSNGVYDTGGAALSGWGQYHTNRVNVDKAITIRSANNDPANTIIKGAWDLNTNGPGAIRCVAMTDGSLIGFTLTNGATLTATESANQEDRRGGGAWMTGSNTVISNCVIVGNSADLFGGGTYAGTLYNCLLRSNIIKLNGGGSSHGTLYNCLVMGNLAQQGAGGGAFQCSLYNCTIVGNRAPYDYGGGVYWAGSAYQCVNSIIYFNDAIGYPNGCNDVGGLAHITNSCTIPALAGDWATGNNITNDPMFIVNGSGFGTNHVAGNNRLNSRSPCVNTGTNLDWMTNSVDLDGRIRIRYGTVDRGAYEFFINTGTRFIFR